MNIVEAYLKFKGQLIILISGISGCGKSSVARKLSNDLNIKYINQFDYYIKNYDNQFTFPNGTNITNWYTDDAIDWTKFNLKDDLEHIDIFEYFRDVQFYDYTKRPRAAVRNDHRNYHITFSDSGDNQEHIDSQLNHTNIATVFFGKVLPEIFKGKRVINGDESDLRFLDPKGVIVGLLAKGKAKKDTLGFSKEVTNV
jgi:hypothetical protein